MTQKDTQRIQNAILLQALPDIVFDGWTMDVARKAAETAGYDRAMVHAVFPGGLNEFVAHFSAWTDQQMLEALRATDMEAMRIRDRVKAGVMERIAVMTPWREVVRRAMAYWAVPTRHLRAAQILWRSADTIWIMAGDTATDYNHYTKRALLGGVISTTTMAWLNDQTGSMKETELFLDRRIENVMQLGKMMGRQRRSG